MSKARPRIPTQHRIPNVAALALPFFDLNENQLTRFRTCMDTTPAEQDERDSRLSSQLLRHRCGSPEKEVLAHAACRTCDVSLRCGIGGELSRDP